MRSVILTAACLIWAGLQPTTIVPRSSGFALLLVFALAGLMDGVEFFTNNFKRKQ